MKAAPKTPKATREMMKSTIAKRLAGREFQLVSEPTGFGGYHVLRVITSAWKNMHKMDRILKMENALLPVIPAAEQKKIFRLSVLTPEEWKELREDDYRRKKFTVLARYKNGAVAARSRTTPSISAKRKVRAAKA